MTADGASPYNTKAMNHFKGKNILVFGLGLNQGGVGSAKFFASQGAKVRVTDLKTGQVLKLSLDQLRQFPDIEYTLGEHKYEDIDWADLIIKNPAVKPPNPHIEYALKQGKQIEMDMGIFLQFIKPSQIIGITGTKGKSTTASLIYKVLKNTDKNVLLAGNIGTSVLDALDQIKKDTLLVLELSSFQMESFDQHKVSPKWAVITNITPDHLNYYSSMDDYVTSKKLIGKYQTKNDFLFIRKNDPATDNLEFLEGMKAKIIRFSKDDLPKDFKSRLVGKHNLENMAAALALTKAFGIPKNQALDVLSNFKGVPFRMELVKVWNGVKIYNDTTATNPDATTQALQTLGSHLGGGRLILIAGGMNKGMNYQKLAKVIEKGVDLLFFLEGDATDILKRLIKNKKIVSGTYNNLMHLLQIVRKIARKGDIVLFSPAATSFNLFQNEFDRGRKFNEAVKKVFH